MKEEKSICRTDIRKWIAISQLRFQKFYRMDLSTLRTILVTFGPENSGVYAVNNTNFCGDTAKIRKMSQNLPTLRV